MHFVKNAFLRLKSIWEQHGLKGIAVRFARKLAFNGQMKSHVETEGASKWIARQLPLERALYSAKIEEFSYLPTISIVCPVCDPPMAFLKEMVESVLGQVYPNWQLCLADDASENREVREYLESLHETDGRITVLFREVRGHIAEASQSALESARGEYVALLDHDDVLPLHALFHIVERLQGDAPPQILYSDEVKISSDGELFEPCVKPDWSPVYFRSFMYSGHLTVYERQLVDRVGGFRSGYDGSQDYDLMLRCSRQTSRISHIPRLLYYWRAHAGSVSASSYAKGYAFDAAKKALCADLEREGGNVEYSILDGPYPGTTVYQSSSTSVEAVMWRDGTTVEELVKELSVVDEELVLIRHEAMPPFSSRQLQTLLGSFAFEETKAVAPLFVSESPEKVVAAGWSQLPNGFDPNFSGASLMFGEQGHRLYVPHEVDAISVLIFAARKSWLLETLNAEESPRSIDSGILQVSDCSLQTSLVLDPRVRVFIPENLIHKTSSLLSTPPTRRYYPVGYSPKRANFRFEA